MFIQTEETPNPDSLKFIPGRILLEKGTASFNKGDDSTRSPLARKLLEICPVTNVFFGTDFMTVTKESQADWSTIKPLILGSLMENFAANLPVLTQNLSPDLGEVNLDNPLEREIRDLLDTRVRPAVAQDGGDITFHSFEKGIVYLKMQGACSGCPSSSATLKSGIENMLKYYIPEVLEVRAIEE